LSQWSSAKKHSLGCFLFLWYKLSMSKNFAIGLVALTIGAVIFAVVAGRIFFQDEKVDAPTGISEGEPDTFNVPQDVQTFFNECKGKGGVIGGTGGVKAGLPTTEEGYTCWYQNRECWDFLTYSKERYMGGNPGCPEANLVQGAPGGQAPAPQVQQQPAQQQPAQQQNIITPSADELVGNWQGNGNIKFSGSQYCKNYTMNWSANIVKEREDYVAGKFVDANGEFVGTIQATWNEKTNTWVATIKSDIVSITNGVMDQSKVSGGFQIKNAWLPCGDITGQSGAFSGSKR
jgi:hypothetical protein